MNSPATVRSLQQRISEMQPVRLDERVLPTHAGLSPLLPGGGLRMGGSYAVHGSRQLALALLSEASQSGLWCGVIGDPTFGAEAAAALGISLERCVVIPDPGDDAMGLTGALAEVLTLVLLTPTSRPSPGETERISARLREHDAALVVTGDWPRPESTLRVTQVRWQGLGQGSGLLSDRELVVQSQDRRGARHHTVHFAGGSLAEPGTAPVRRLVAS
ncbi:hypothetical protein [Leucobacter sp. USHLN153]|uniref:hypothetical protein n=1 Tax=Leucobacter sp. USHLN153 TaxID=3081268 RepID=UPI003019471C